jgi:hypothetical protein
MRVVITAIVGLMLLLPAAADAACAVKDIEIKSWKWTRDAGWFRIAGELANNCAEPNDVRLEVTFRDERGQVVSVEDAWAGGQRNIAGRATQAFTISMRAYARLRMSLSALPKSGAGAAHEASSLTAR